MADQSAPWERLHALLEPFYPKGWQQRRRSVAGVVGADAADLSAATMVQLVRSRPRCAGSIRFRPGRNWRAINRELFDRITAAKLAEGASNATINRHPALVRTTLRRCHRDWEWIDRAVVVRFLKEPIRCMRFLTQQQGKCAVYVFTYEGNPVKQVSTRAWYKALKRAGIENFRWHDLRHTWASWHVQNGTPLHVLQELGGWETLSMVRRYAHFGVGSLSLTVSQT